MFFTIVIPACDVENYIAAAVKSVQRQSRALFEALVICEESKDATRAKAADAIRGDARFSIVDLPRSGSASVSRNFGMEHARGEYIVFLDGDDQLEPDSLQKIAAAAESNGFPDVIACEYVNWREIKDAPPVKCGGEQPYRGKGRTLSGMDALAGFLEDGSYQSATWRNVYRAELLRDPSLRQAPGRRHQDDEWTPRVFCAAKTALISGIVLYNYLKRANSVTTTVSLASMRDVSDNLDSGFAFACSEKFTPRLRKQFACWLLYAAARFFSPIWCERYPRNERAKEFRHLMLSHGNIFRYMALIPHGRPRDVLFASGALFAAVIPCFRLIEKFHTLMYVKGRVRQ